MSIKSVAKTLISHFNFSVSVTLNQKTFKVPILKNMGFLNRALKEDWFFNLLKSFKMPEGAVFIDVGVNVGQTLLKYKSCHNNPYIGFEPNPSCVFYVNNLVQVNELKNVNILPVGLSTESHLAKFYTKNEVDSAGTTVGDLRPGFYDASSVTYVPVFAFDKLELDNNNKIALVKIDVEGGELEVLQGMKETLSTHKPVIICEILDSHTENNIPNMQKRADTLIALMHGLNYDIYRILHSSGTIKPEKIETVQIKKWTPESWDLNDYLFLPNGVSYTDIIK